MCLIFGEGEGKQERQVEKPKIVVDIPSGMGGEINKTDMRTRMLHSTSPVFIPTNNIHGLLTEG